MLRILAFLLTLPLAAGCFQAASASSILIDLESGQTVLSENPDVPADASALLPVMAVYAALDVIGSGTGSKTLFDKAPSPWQPAPQKGSKAPEVLEITLEEQLQGLLMTGDLRALDSILSALGLSQGAFSKSMQAAAEKLGLSGTQFAYPCGESAPCISTAREMARLADALYQDFPIARVWGASASLDLPGGITLKNQNFFLEASPAVAGVYISVSDKDARSSALLLSENPIGSGSRLRRLLAAALNEQSARQMREKISSMMLRGYRDYETLKVFDKGSFVADIPVFKSDSSTVRALAAETAFATITREQMLTSGSEAIELQVRYASPLVAPIEEGAVIGELEIYAGHKLARTVALVAGERIEEGSFWSRLRDTVRLALSQDALH